MPEKELTTVPQNNTLAKAQTDFMSRVLKDLDKMNCVYTDYGKICGLNILSEINRMLTKEGKHLEDDDIDSLSVVSAVQFAMTTELNVQNKEVFIQLRNITMKTGERYQDKATGKWLDKSKYVKSIECKPQYRGQMKLLAKFGTNVEKVYPMWVVRQNDVFKYPKFDGIEKMLPPVWEMHDCDAPVVRVVVPVCYHVKGTDERYVQYHIAELSSLATNIKAQIKQTLLGCSKDEALRVGELMKDMTLEELISNPTLAKYINSTYTGISREEMWITKLYLNATKRIPVDYGSAFVRELVEKTYDNSDVYEKDHHARDVVDEQEIAAEVSHEEVKQVEEKKTDDAVTLPDDDLPWENMDDKPSDDIPQSAEELFK